MNQFNWDQAFTLDFDLNDGLSRHAETTKRYLSQMKDMYQDQEAVDEILKNDDPLIYEFVEQMEKGKALYVPRGYAHRTINTGNETLTAFYVFDANAGHDYGTIETKGYRHIVCEIDGKMKVLDNPRW